MYIYGKLIIYSTKRKDIKMDKKAKLTFIFTIITWLLVSSSSILFSNIISGWYGIFIGLGVMLVSLIIHLIARARNPKLYLISSCINALATGIAMSSYYAYAKIELPLDILGITLLCYILLSYLICMGVYKIQSKKKAAWLFGGLFLVLLIITIAAWKSSSLFSIAFFALIIVFFYFLLEMKTFHTTRNYLSDLSLASFGIFFLIAYIVIVLISDGDGLELIDFVGDGGKQKKKV